MKMLDSLNKIVSEFKENSRDKTVKVVSDYDTDGITAASIITRALKKEDRKFSVKIVKHLEKETLYEIKDYARSSDIFIFLDIGSSVLGILSEFPCEVIVLDHHQIPEEQDAGILDNLKNVRLFNPRLYNEDVSAAGLAYLFARALNEENVESTNLAIVGMVGDMLDQSISKVNDRILKEAKEAGEVTVKKGPLIFSATRPLNKALEFSSNFFIPGVTGSSVGAMELLRESGLKYENGRFPTLNDLTEEELSRLITGIMLRRVNKTERHDDIIGNIYLVKFFGKLEDAREISAMINACSRMGQAEVALMFCLENGSARSKVQDIYDSYKHEIINALKFVENCKKVESKKYIIINAKDKIRDSIIGTIMSIVSHSFLYEEGKIIVGMAYNGEKIKVSARICGKTSSVDLGKVMSEVVKITGGESGGHEKAAGCFISKEKEEEFIKVLSRNLDIEEIKIAI